MSKLHPWFHVSLLKSYHDGDRVDLVPPPHIILDDEIEYQIERIISHRDLSNSKTKYLVKWTGYGPEENSWLARSAIEDTVALDHYLAKLDGRIRPASRLISDAKRPAPKRTSTRLRRRKI